MATQKVLSLGSAPRCRVQVTRADIDRAEVRNSGHCMAADALKRAYPHLSHIMVDIQTMRATDRVKGERYIWLTPGIVQDMIIDFDQEIHVEEFTYELQRRFSQTVSAGFNRKKFQRVGMRPGETTGSVPLRVGGQAPPRAGQRREWGLRGHRR